MKLPFLVSVPHAGLSIPKEVQDICSLAPDQILADSDGGAAEIYYGLEKSAGAFIAADVARAIVDLNRAADDFRKDGVIKTHTSYDIPVYNRFPSRARIEQLLAVYHSPYHQQLEKLAESEKVKIGLDCHTMAEVGPPIGPDAGKARPLVCISNADGTCSHELLRKLADCFQKVFPQQQININDPFRGGYIIRQHSAKLPWIQIELSRTKIISNVKKKEGVFKALSMWRQSIP